MSRLSDGEIVLFINYSGGQSKVRVTLKKMREAKGYSQFEGLKLKKEMLNHQKSGKVFFDVDIVALDENIEFDLFYSVLPNKSSDKRAFPVPMNYFQVHKSEHEQFLYLKGFFESYYEGEELVESELMTFEFKKPFVGDEFVWYYKRTASFS